jgi:hypothetical protein
MTVLAEALSVSSLWEGSLATLVVRSSPSPLLGVIGFFDEVVRARLEALCWRLRYGASSPRYVGYAEAEQDCEQLAAELRARWSPRELREFGYVAIPRGGFFVLGMLSYILDLPASAFTQPPSSDKPLVVVDDCALSGTRFRLFLQHCSHSSIVFAHLYSHPELRSAVAACEERVLACVNAQDLHDYAPEIYGAHYEAWRGEWRARLPGYWVGHTEHLCFAWNEPDFAELNEATGQIEPGWRLVSGEKCLRNRATASGDRVPVQLQPSAKGPLVPPAHVVFAKLADTLVIGNARTGEATALDGVAADMWEAILAKGDREGAAAALLETYDVAPPTLHSDLEEFIGEATARGLLTGQP